MALGLSEVLSPCFEDELGMGENAEDKSCAMSMADQVVDMLSSNLGSSMTRTSAADRSPRIVAEAASSSLRVSPRPSAFPDMQGQNSTHTSGG